MHPTVTALLVSHDGARWLPTVLDGLASQTVAPARVVAVDTGSRDDSPTLLRERVGTLHELPASTSYGAAVLAALAELPAADGDEWIWLLHDDSTPDPGALEALLRAAESDATADLLGPKIREWPSLRRLLEVGVTLGPTGQRETGLERGEYDQGQHDDVREVLAVNTAGLLVRRRALEKLGFDPALPVLGADVDLGWRAARAGLRTLVVPDAVVFHVEAAHRGVRRTTLTGSRPRRRHRAAALHTLLANGSAAWLPLTAVRLLLGGLLRALGLLLVRAPAEAWDEVVALASVLGRPWRVVAARRRRRRTVTRRAREVRSLLAPWWLPYRHGLDFLGEMATAVVHQAGDMSAARRTRAEAAADTGPVPAEAQSLPDDTGLVARTLASPVAWAFAALALAAAFAARNLVGDGALAGGALLPAPDGASAWWQLHLAEGHGLGTGSTAAAAPYVLPLALGGTLLLGKAWLVLDLLMLLAVPLAAFGGYRLLRRLVPGSPRLALWGAAAYGLLPVLTGAVQQGRLGTVAAAVVLPWLVQSATFLHPAHDADRRWRAAWRTALWLALVAAFVPLALLLAAVVTVAAVLALARVDNRRTALLPVLVPAPVALVLLLPWSVEVWTHQGPAAWLFEAGLPAPALTEPRTPLDVALLSAAPEAAPWWAVAGLVAAAVGALLRPDTRRRVLISWAVLVLALVTAAVLSRVATAPASSAAEQPLWLGFPLLLAGGAAVTAAAIAGSGIRERLAGRAFGWRQPVGAALVAVALVTPVAGALWWVVSGTDDPLTRRGASPVPSYMADAALADPAAGVLVVRGDRATGFSHVLVRGPGLRLGDESVLPTVAQQEPLTGTVASLVTDPGPEDLAALGDLGVRHVYAPPPVDGRLAGNLDALSGLTTASATREGARAWQLADDVDASWSAPADPWHPVGVAVQALALLVVAVLAAPTREVSR